MEPEFADSLLSLTLKGQLSIDDVILLVPQFPRIKWLNLEGIVTESIESDHKMTGQISKERKEHVPNPICNNKSLRFLRATDLCVYDYMDSYHDASTSSDVELELYRGLIFDL
ncbi:hypothetical protein GGI21_002853, partial [Coemansia aciculifera]